MTEHLRAHLEAIRDDKGIDVNDKGHVLWLQCVARMRANAVAALAILDTAPRVSAIDYVHGVRTSDTAHIYDPVPGSTIATRETHT